MYQTKILIFLKFFIHSFMHLLENFIFQVF